MLARNLSRRARYPCVRLSAPSLEASTMEGFPMDAPMFSRSGRSDAGGKLTERLDVPLSEETAEAVIALAAMAGMSKSEYARSIIERAVYGDLAMLRRLARPLQPSQDRASAISPGRSSDQSSF